MFVVTSLTFAQSISNNVSEKKIENIISPNCKKWFDGCNYCSKVSMKGVQRCTKKACKEDFQKPQKCLEYFDSKTPDLKDPLPGQYHPKSCNKVYSPVCAEKKGKKITYSNECEASKDYAKIIYRKKCESSANDNDSKILGPPIFVGPKKKICTEQYTPVCAEKNNHKIIYPNECYAFNDDAKVLYAGKCKQQKDVKIAPPKKVQFFKNKTSKIDLNIDNAKQIKISSGQNTKSGLQIQEGNIKAEVEGKLEVDLEKQNIIFENNVIKVTPQEVVEKIKKTFNAEKINFKENFVLKKKDNKTIYNTTLVEKGHFLGLFSIDMEIKVEVDAQNGQVTNKKPWWSFLVF